MLAYPTARFDAKTILQAPGYRPTGKGACYVYEAQPEANTPLNKINHNTKNGGFVGNFSRNIPKSTQWSPKQYDPTKGTPLSVPGSVGNVGDQAIALRPTMAEPKNEQMRLIKNILDGKVAVSAGVGMLTAKSLASLEPKKSGAFSPPLNPASQFAVDFTDTARAMKREARIKNAVSQGFSVKEATEAYDKLRQREAEKALFLQQDVSTRLYDLIDSRLGSMQDGAVPGNDESALFLAKGGNAVDLKESQTKNQRISAAVAKASGAREPKEVSTGIARGRPKSVSAEQGSTQSAINSYFKRMKKGTKD